MRNVGANLLVTQKIVGHTPREITERVYTHVTLEEMIEAIDLLP
jgi:integrase